MCFICVNVNEHFERKINYTYTHVFESALQTELTVERVFFGKILKPYD